MSERGRTSRRAFLAGSAAAAAAVATRTASASAAATAALTADVAVVGAGLAGLTTARGWSPAGTPSWCSRRATGSAAGR